MELEEVKELTKLDEDIIAGKPKIFLGICIGLLIFVAIIAATVFFLSVRGAEETMVPDIRGKQLVDALLELQQKELYPRIQLRYSQSADEKNTILEQDPRSGTIVKAGRRIRLVVSQGVMVSTVSNYVGRIIDDVRQEVSVLNANNPSPIITLKEPFLYQYSTKSAGIILEQSPPPGTGIAANVAVEFVISKGYRKEFNTMPNVAGLKIGEALPLLEESGIRWVFDYLYDGNNRAGEIILAQEPSGYLNIAPEKVARITIAETADLDENEVFGIFKYTLAENPYPLATKLEVILPSGDRQTIGIVRHAGGEFTYPYRAVHGSILVLSLLDREITRQSVE
ncbi:MAG: PASTA domain-containing protein [Termitinemataceae bacterium]|nr:MAG: PASTA domain-containing protein [Termitinemataceae bacterium]